MRITPCLMRARSHRPPLLHLFLTPPLMVWLLFRSATSLSQRATSGRFALGLQRGASRGQGWRKIVFRLRNTAALAELLR